MRPQTLPGKVWPFPIFWATPEEYTRYQPRKVEKGSHAVIEIPLDFGGPLPLYRQIADHLRSMIETGALNRGFRLPGTRSFAASLGVSRTTLNEAFHVLEADGWIRLEGRSGAFVLGQPPTAHPTLRSPAWMDLASGIPSTDFLPLRHLSSLWRSILQEEDGALLMSPVAGLEALRQMLVRHAASRGIPARWQDVVVTSGVQEGLALALETLRRQGVERIWTEPLTYPQIPPLAASLGLSLHLLPEQPEAWEEILPLRGPRDALYLIPSFHNPTGRTLSQPLRESILSRTAHQGCWIIEDDAYGELRYGENTVPALRALPEASRVLYLGSFSQLLFPGWRLGYALIPPALHSTFVHAKLHRSGATAAPSQHLTLAFLRQGLLEPALNTIRNGMARRMANLHTLLHEAFPELSPEIPQGGIYLWLPTPGWSGREAALKARHLGVLVTAGDLFAPDHRPVEAVRLAVSRLSIVDTARAIRAVSQAWSGAPWTATTHS